MYKESKDWLRIKPHKYLGQINKIDEGGLGLGLSMVKTICEIHKALLILENNKEGITTGIWFNKKK